jgi:hypothetical protein
VELGLIELRAAGRAPWIPSYAGMTKNPDNRHKETLNKS